jgi:ABC-type uncharacterized transport system auxiliary subunit
MKKNFNALCALMLLALPLSACGGGAPPPAEHFYRLNAPQLSAAAKPLPGILIVERLRADGVTSERPMAHSKAGQEKALETYRYHYWTEAPGRMLQQLLVKSLKDAKAAKDVLTDEIRVEGDWILRGRLTHFEQVLGGRPRVLLEADLSLVKAKDSSLALHAVYREEEEANGESPAAAVEAMQKALERLTKRLAGDLKAN